MKIATWNVNSVRVREERLVRWLDAHAPDALCLQELKVQDDAFCHDPVIAAGYRAAVHGQKTYNGVAILAREEPADVRRTLDDDAEDPQARLIAATVSGIRVICGYFPNGSTPDSDKYVYKRQWLARLLRYLERHHTPDEPLALCGDFNIAPDERDVRDLDAWRGSVLFNEEMTAAFEGLLRWGLVDAFRVHHPEAGLYSWWDYRQLGFQRNDGLRIDHVLLTRPLAERCTGAWIDRDERKGKQPSDHAPVVVEVAWG